MSKNLSRFILKLIGWEVNFDVQPIPDKYILAVVPHTSSWDFFLGLFTRGVMGTDTKYIGKKSLFRWPFGPIFRSLGGYPVDRSKNNNFVDSVVDIFNSKEKFSIALAPEGTRKKVDKLKTGFYYIAKGANIPIILVRFDYQNREVTFSDPFLPTDDMEADFKFIDDHFRGTHGKIPENSYLYGG